MSARENILGRIRQARRAGGDAGQSPEAWLKAKSPGPIPARARPEDPVLAFAHWAGVHDASIDRVTSQAEIPHAVAQYLRSRNQPARVALNPDKVTAALPWGDTGLEVRTGPAEASDSASVTPAFAAVAETGTLMLRSGSDAATTLNFLPENHIVILQRSQITGSFEEAWARLRAAGNTPRTVNLITGPSRTADIAQTLYMGAHGPCRLHIVLVDDG